jgi:hypothetical protein
VVIIKMSGACCLPSQKKAPRGRRRPDPLADVWDRLAGKRLSIVQNCVGAFLRVLVNVGPAPHML